MFLSGVRIGTPLMTSIKLTRQVQYQATPTNWDFTGADPIAGVRANDANHTAIVGDPLITGPTIVGTHAAVTINRIPFDNAARTPMSVEGSLFFGFDRSKET